MIYTKCVHQSLNRHNRLFLATLTALAFLAASVIAILTATDSYLINLSDSKARVYGSFTDIIYQNNPAYSSSKDLDPAQYGIITAYTIKKEDPVPIILGTINSLGQTLGFQDSLSVKLAELPERHCVVTLSAARTHFANAGVGSRIEAGGHELIIDAVIPDYGLLWIRGEVEEINYQLPPNIFVSKHTFNAIPLAESQKHAVVLIPVNYGNEVLEKIPGNHYKNTQIDIRQEIMLFQFPAFFNYLMLAMILVILLSFLFVFKSRSIAKYRTLYRLGITGKSFLATQYYEYFFIIITSCFLGIIFSIIPSVIILTITHNGFVIQILPWLKNSGMVTAVYLFGYLIFYLVSGIKVPDLSNQLIFKKRIWPASATPLKKPIKMQTVILHDARRSVNRYISLSGMAIVACTILVFTFSYFDVMNQVTSITNAFGRMAQDYDYQVTQVPPNPAPLTAYNGDQFYDNRKSEIALLHSYVKDEILDRLSLELTMVAGVRQVDIYKEKYAIYTAMTKKQSDAPYVQSIYRSWVYGAEHAFFSRKLQLDDRSLISSQIVGLPDHNLRELAHYFGDGVDIDSVIRGETCLVVTPSYRFEIETREREPGVMSTLTKWEFVSSADENLVRDTNLKSGERATLVFLDSAESAYGAFTLDQASDIFKIRKIDVPIAGISSANVGWFSVNDSPPLPYRYIVSNSFFESHEIEVSTSRIRVWLHSAGNKENARYTIKQLTSRFGNLKLVDLSDQLATLHAYRVMQYGFKAVLIILFFMVSLPVAYTLVQAIFEKRRKNLEIFVLLGFGKKRLFRHMFGPVLIFNAIASIVGYQAFRILLTQIISLWINTAFEKQIFLTAVPFVIFTFLTSVVTWRATEKFISRVYQTFE